MSRTRNQTQAPVSKRSWGFWAEALLLFGGVLLIYLPAFRGGFIWNDPDYVTRPELQGLRGLWRIWFEVGATEQYYPLLHSFFWVQHRMWGDWPAGYHAVNVLLHASCAVLVALIVGRLFGGRRGRWIGLTTGMLFAVHPVYVESVAWISEQKNTFSLLWYLLAGLAYLRWEEERDRGRRAGKWYGWATVCFVAAVLAKSLTASLPAALLVVAWWRRGRLEWRRDVRPLVPWLGFGAAMGAFTGWVEHTYIGAQGSDFALGLVERGMLAGRVIWFYLTKYAWPAELIFIYPHWEVSAGQWWQWLYPLGALGLLAGLWALRGRWRGPLAAYLYFVGSLVPTIGFFNVYAFKFSYVADHWNYLPSLGLATAAGAGLVALIERLGRPGARQLAGAAAAAGIALLAVLSWRQCGLYHDMRTFLELSLKANPNSWMLHQNLGVMLMADGKVDEAVAHFQRELELRPGEAEAENNLGVAAVRLGKSDEALTRFRSAVQLKPDYAEAWYNLGLALHDAGQLDEARTALETTLRLRPDAADAAEELGEVDVAQGHTDDAESRFRAALRIRPQFPKAALNLGRLLLEAGQTDEATAFFKRVVLPSTDPDLLDRAGALLANAGQSNDARQQFQRALDLDPNRAGTHFNLGLMLARAGLVADAVAEFEKSVQLRPDNPDAWRALSQAYMETGRMQDAQDAAARSAQLDALQPRSPSAAPNGP